MSLKIAVCMKRVPEMDVKFRIASSGAAIDETGLKWDMSDFDGYACEAALQMVEKAGAGEVVAISLGPDAAQETLRKALSMGVARAVHLKADPMPFDGWVIANALAAELNGGGYDLVMFGRMSLDSANGVVGAMVAELLELPCVTSCSRLDVSDGVATARRELEGGAELLTFPLPAVVTIDEGIARPRYPSHKGIMAAKKNPLESKPAELGEARLTVTKMALPAERGAGKIIGEGPEAVPELVRLLQTEAKVL
jgi:electron transfer flavoprotein beta subunit